MLRGFESHRYQYNNIFFITGIVPEWSKGSDLRSDAIMLRGFESHRYQFIIIFFIIIARLAQLVERKTFNLVVVGSSPTVGKFLYYFIKLWIA